MEHDEILAQARKLGIVPGDSVEVQFKDGSTAQGAFNHHVLAGWCIKQPGGLPMNFERLVRKLQ